MEILWATVAVFLAYYAGKGKGYRDAKEERMILITLHKMGEEKAEELAQDEAQS